MGLLKLPRIFLLLTSATAIGCAGEVVYEAGAETSSTHVLLIVEQTASAQETQATRSRASLWFLRIADEKDFSAAAGLVAARSDLPAVGTCAAFGGEPNNTLTSRMSRVDLAFAGDAQIRTHGTSAPLTVRFFPDVAGLVSGVVYTLQDQSDLAEPFDGLLSVVATGSSEFESVEAFARTPSLPEAVTVNGVDVRTVDTSTTLEVTRGATVALGWTADNEGDVIYVDLDSVPAVPSERVRCVFTDTGTAEIPTEALPESEEIGIAIHRSRDVSLRSGWDDAGMAYFDLALATRVRVVSPAVFP